MPDTRTHRGMHPEDPVAFAERAWPELRTATAELSYLLGHGYAPVSSLKLVGDRHALSSRQRAAVARCACDDERALARTARAVPEQALRGRALLVDGFNVLTTLEVALSGGVVLLGRDGAMRDIAGVHGSYRKVEETVPALGLLARLASTLGVRCVDFLLDEPVSNSGRLRALIADHARTHGWPFDAHVVRDPDVELAASVEITATADGEVLDRSAQWFNLARTCVERLIPKARIVDLSSGDRGAA